MSFFYSSLYDQLYELVYTCASGSGIAISAKALLSSKCWYVCAMNVKIGSYLWNETSYSTSTTLASQFPVLCMTRKRSAVVKHPLVCLCNLLVHSYTEKHRIVETSLYLILNSLLLLAFSLFLFSSLPLSRNEQ